MVLYDLIQMEPHIDFHDGQFERVSLDYVAREMSVSCLLYTERRHSSSLQRHGTLTLTGLLFCVMQPPDPDYPFDKAKGLDITADGDALSAKWVSPLTFPAVDESQAFVHYFFVNEWNSLLYVGTTGARFTWA